MKAAIDWLKEYWFLIVFMGAVSAAYVEWRVDTINGKRVAESLAALSVPSQSDFDKLEARVIVNEENVADNTKDLDKLYDKIERVINILLEE